MSPSTSTKQRKSVQPPLDEDFAQFNLSPKKKFLFRKLAGDLKQRIGIIRRPLTKLPTQKRNEERQHLLGYADSHEKSLCLVNDLLGMDENGRIPSFLKWLDSETRLIWLAANAESMSRQTAPLNWVYCTSGHAEASLAWAMNIIERDFIGCYQAERELRVHRLILAGHYNFFPTPTAVTSIIFDYLPHLEDGDTFLEPEAGTGDLALETIRLYQSKNGVQVFADCVEWSWPLFEVLSE